MGQFLLCAGAPGKRFALPHSRILMHQPSGAMQGQAADIAIQAEQIIYLKRMMAERIAFHTGQPLERIETDSDRDRWFTADEAREYGFIDQVIEIRHGGGREQIDVALDVRHLVEPRRRRSGRRRRSRTARRHRREHAASAPAQSPRQVTVVTPTISVRQRLREIWVLRELLIYLVRTEIKVKYKNSVLGFVWSMVAPAMTLAIYFFVFQIVAGQQDAELRHLPVRRAAAVEPLLPRRADRHRGRGEQRRDRQEGLVPPRDPGPGRGRLGLRLLLLPGHRHGIFMVCPASAPDLAYFPLLLAGPGRAASSSPRLCRPLSSINVYLRDTQHLIEVVLTAWFWACPIVYPYQISARSWPRTG